MAIGEEAPVIAASNVEDVQTDLTNRATVLQKDNRTITSPEGTQPPQEQQQRPMQRLEQISNPELVNQPPQPYFQNSTQQSQIIKQTDDSNNATGLSERSQDHLGRYSDNHRPMQYIQQKENFAPIVQQVSSLSQQPSNDPPSQHQTLLPSEQSQLPLQPQPPPSALSNGQTLLTQQNTEQPKQISKLLTDITSAPLKLSTFVPEKPEQREGPANKDDPSSQRMMFSVADPAVGVFRKHRVRKEGNVCWHQCNQCPKEFKKPSDLVRHIRIHTRVSEDLSHEALF